MNKENIILETLIKLDHKVDLLAMKLKEHDTRFDCVETALLENAANVKNLTNHVKRVTHNHEARITRLEKSAL